MKINLQKKLVTLTPDTPEERVMLQAVWRLLIDCNGQARSLAPIGEFSPAKHHPAQFAIEGEGAENLPTIPNVVVDFECKVYCDICNRIQDVKKGESIPPCCGKLMEFMD
jgi:hypothetical protein